MRKPCDQGNHCSRLLGRKCHERGRGERAFRFEGRLSERRGGVPCRGDCGQSRCGRAQGLPDLLCGFPHEMARAFPNHIAKGPVSAERKGERCRGRLPFRRRRRAEGTQDGEAVLKGRPGAGHARFGDPQESTQRCHPRRLGVEELAMARARLLPASGTEGQELGQGLPGLAQLRLYREGLLIGLDRAVHVLEGPRAQSTELQKDFAEPGAVRRCIVGREARERIGGLAPLAKRAQQPCRREGVCEVRRIALGRLTVGGRSI
ncbi:MAG TPA: hypothetical protein DEP35_04400, partial [Deltaproteobacteria bacterium]|nr:hypothetical protein [Deltaproteobacteria bacterium]